MKSHPRFGPLMAAALALLGLAAITDVVSAQEKKPNILCIWGDDIGTWNISHNNRGMMGYKTPNIDRIAKEGVFPTRFQYVEQLHKLGANIQLSGESAIIKGVPKLIGAPVSPTDLRAAAAMVIAGLMAEGQTTIHNLEYLDRGYEDFIEKLKSLKAVIERGK